MSGVLPNNYDFKSWIPTCIECLQFALDNEELLNENPELYQDTLYTLSLLYSWIIEDKDWAYIELKQKFRKIYSPKEVGNALKEFSKRLTEQKEEIYKGDCLVNYKDADGNFKSMAQILSELSILWKSQ